MNWKGGGKRAEGDYILYSDHRPFESPLASALEAKVVM